MLGAKRDQRRTGGSARCGMRCVSPVDEERHKPVGDHCPLVADMPRQKSTGWRAPASWCHVADWYTEAARLGDELRQVRSLGGPGHEPRLLQIVEQEFPRT